MLLKITSSLAKPERIKTTIPLFSNKIISKTDPIYKIKKDFNTSGTINKIIRVIITIV